MSWKLSRTVPRGALLGDQGGLLDHGYENLCTVMGLLMMLAFLIDQAQELCCMVFKKARKLTGRYTTLWETMRILFITECFENWNDLFFKIIELWTPPEKNTS